jgi:hypothetical protein
MKLCLIGAGASGLLLILLLTQKGFTDIVCIDPYFDCGELQRSWPTVISNTPWSATLESIRSHLPSLSIPSWATALNPDNTTEVSVIAKLIRELAAPILARLQLIQSRATQLSWDSTTKKWTVLTGTKTVLVDRLCLAQGSQAKTLDLSIPSIPLAVALDKTRLSSYVDKSTQKVLVFGTQHSGSIVLKNLIDCSAQSITAVYKGSSVFRFARDGDYNGIKRESAAFADNVLKGAYPAIRFISSDDTSELIREGRTADWVVYALGFERTAIPITVDGVQTTPTYDGASGKLSCPNAWGFGIAYPSQAPDGIHWDVGISSFLEHMNRQLDFIITL